MTVLLSDFASIIKEYFIPNMERVCMLLCLGSTVIIFVLLWVIYILYKKKGDLIQLDVKILKVLSVSFQENKDDKVEQLRKTLELEVTKHKATEQKLKAYESYKWVLLAVFIILQIKDKIKPPKKTDNSPNETKTTSDGQNETT